MKTPISSQFIYAMLLSVLLSFQAGCQSESIKASAIRDQILRSQVGIDFYGKVLDGQGLPVTGALVKIHIQHYSPTAVMFLGISKHERRSDANGCFSVKGIDGLGLSIESITKIGYEYSRSSNLNSSFEYQKSFTNLHRPDTRSPVVFRLRKKGPEALLMKGGGRFAFTADESGTYKGYDFFREGSAFSMKPEELEHPKVYGEPVTCDLRVQATFDARRGLWALVLAPGNADGGILASKDLLYEAPASGYQPSLTFEVPGKLDQEPKAWDSIRTPVPARYLYLRSRKGPTHSIYSRIDLGEEFRVSWTPPPEKGDAPVASIHLGASATINPYGERILEEATELPGDVSFELRKEVRAAVRRGERPEAPNLAQRVKLWEQSRPLMDKVKDWFKP